MTRSLPLLLALTALAAPSVAWMGTGWTRAADGPAQALVAALGLWLGLRGLSIGEVRWRPLPLVVAALGPLLGAVPLESARAAGVIAAAWGVAGLVGPAGTFARLGPLAVLLVTTLPVGDAVDAIFGWPLRKALASVVAAALGGVSAEDVIRLEGTVAHVDLPCAGVRSLWSVGASSSLAALARGAPLGPRWVAGLAAGAVTALLANAGRIAVLVATLGLGWPLLAETLHVPLGVFGFAAAVLATLAVPADRPSLAEAPARPWAGYALATWLVVAAVWPPPERAAPTPPPPPVLAGWTEVAPSAPELAFARERGASITKATRGPVSLVAVASRSALAQHVPEQCLRAAGWSLVEERPLAVPRGAVRVAVVERDGVRAEAAWWFDDGERAFGDPLARWADRSGSTWVLFSALGPAGTDWGAVVQRVSGEGAS